MLFGVFFSTFTANNPVQSGPFHRDFAAFYDNPFFFITLPAVGAILA